MGNYPPAEKILLNWPSIYICHHGGYPARHGEKVELQCFNEIYIKTACELEALHRLNEVMSFFFFFKPRSYVKNLSRALI